jgi:hypothetical protein
VDSGRHGPVNRPWRLVLGLPGALAAAVATAAFGLVSSPVWQISAAMGTERPWIATAVSLLTVIGWLILNHGRRSGAGSH